MHAAPCATAHLPASDHCPPAIPHLQCIGATTRDEHRKHIERDAALERCATRALERGAVQRGSSPGSWLGWCAVGAGLAPLLDWDRPPPPRCLPHPAPAPPACSRFQPVVVDEPSEPEALEILQGLRERYERHHRCMYAPEALEAAVHLSARYLPDRRLPDKVRRCRRRRRRCCCCGQLLLGGRSKGRPGACCRGGGRRPTASSACLCLAATTAPTHRPTPLPPAFPSPPQAIDLLDEAGSRVRIASYMARKEAGGREGLEAANTRWG